MKITRHLDATVILAFFIVSTATVRGEDYLYETNNGTITITGYTGSGGDVTIPSTISGLPVTTIGDSPFWDCTNLTSITIPDSVTSIGESAFGLCASLTSVIIGNSVTTIRDDAFWECTSLTSITIPDSVTTIGNGVFGHCTSLTSVTIPNSVTTIGLYAFYWCTGLTNVTIPDSVTTIGAGAFQDCTSLTSIPSSVVTTIEDLTFHGCTGLTNVTIPDSVTTIGNDAFWDCTSLTSITIPDSVTTIGDSAFSGCTSLTAVYFKGNAPQLLADWNGDVRVFEGAPNATIYYLPWTMGWSTTFGGRPTTPWLLPYPVIVTTAPNFGIQTNQIGFRISWATNAPVVVEASTTLANPVWSPVSTNTLTEGWTYFSDAEWTNYPARFYRVRQW